MGFNFNEEKILITGANGMVGTALVPKVPNALCPTIHELDLTNFGQTVEYFQKHRPQYVIHLAAKVGGVLANSNHLAEFYTENIMMNTNVLHAAYITGVEKVVSLLSTCVYPDHCTYPLTEDQIHNGPPHKSNYTYAYTKRMLDIQSKAYRDQYGCNFITVVPNNLYGRGDFFGLEGSHVIPAMIRKFHESEEVVLWGTGEPIREFTYSYDLADILLFLLDNYNEREPINVGNREGYSISKVAEIVNLLCGKRRKIIWDLDKPNGQLKKPSSNEKLLSLFKAHSFEFNYTNLYDGLKETYDWFKTNYPNIRGINL